MASAHQHKPKKQVPPKNAQLQGELVNHPQEINGNACEIT
jgi:hypothetical protein